MVATRTRNYGSPLVASRPDKVGKRRARTPVLAGGSKCKHVASPRLPRKQLQKAVAGPWKSRILSVLLGLFGVLSHGILVNVYGRTCGIDALNPASWLLGMYSVNSTWCNTLHWLTHATAMATEKVAAAACVLVAMRLGH